MKLRHSLVGAGAAAALAFVSAGCGSNTAKASAPKPGPSTAISDTTSYGTNEVDVNIVPHAIMMANVDAQGTAAGKAGYKAGVRHDIVAPSTFVVKSGAKVTITAWNYDDGPHSITLDDSSQLPGFNFVIAAGNKNSDGTVTPVKSTIAFTAPTVAKGTILDIPWHCALPCDGPTHLGMETQGNNLAGYDGIMAGHIVVMA